MFRVRRFTDEHHAVHEGRIPRRNSASSVFIAAQLESKQTSVRPRCIVSVFFRPLSCHIQWVESSPQFHLLTRELGRTEKRLRHQEVIVLQEEASVCTDAVQHVQAMWTWSMCCHSLQISPKCPSVKSILYRFIQFDQLLIKQFILHKEN